MLIYAETFARQRHTQPSRAYGAQLNSRLPCSTWAPTASRPQRQMPQVLRSPSDAPGTNTEDPSSRIAETSTLTCTVEDVTKLHKMIDVLRGGT